jgi:hypothetical protein
MNPDPPVSPPLPDPGRINTKSLPELVAVFSPAKHPEQESREKNDENDREQEVVEKPHEKNHRLEK